MTVTIANFLIVQNKTNKTLHIKQTLDLHNTYDVIYTASLLPLAEQHFKFHQIQLTGHVRTTQPHLYRILDILSSNSCGRRQPRLKIS